MVTKQPYLHRKSMRLKGYDYSQPGAYFITYVSFQRKCLFGNVMAGEMQLNAIGNIIQSELRTIPIHFQPSRLDAFIIMPNHIHGIIVINYSPVMVPGHSVDGYFDNNNESSLKHYPPGPIVNSIGAIISQFKSRATKRIRKQPEIANQPIWQRNYYDHIIRNEQEYDHIIQYIEANPSAWSEDEYFTMP